MWQALSQPTQHTHACLRSTSLPFLQYVVAKIARSASGLQGQHTKCHPLPGSGCPAPLRVVVPSCQHPPPRKYSTGVYTPPRTPSRLPMAPAKRCQYAGSTCAHRLRTNITCMLSRAAHAVLWLLTVPVPILTARPPMQRHLCPTHA
jgi:hypothetical protein